ncbi:FAD synthetase 2, chloroplastic-like [Selaginella moellendorffii]|uniref:FAD synthetase 2, chloroplastic-like n=1 Tax=Selaginella moellendorffii TaxID=88036 RepID=UPI000D1CB80C|nr:FAD synthetase 2, chloroplastic-like [Selaginella moellendorffii]|eukprot:XP_024538256.1 FAD synthetase 2, chloroplastic-like [Selaginella moellendorffii]
MQSTARWNAPSSHHILLTGILATGTAAISSKRLKLHVVASQAPASPSSQAMDSPHRPQAMDSPQRRQESGKLAGSVVALGKFDALHIGHRSLAEQASRMGPPVVLSFTGMGEILGWDKR